MDIMEDEEEHTKFFLGMYSLWELQILQDEEEGGNTDNEIESISSECLPGDGNCEDTDGRSEQRMMKLNRG